MLQFVRPGSSTKPHGPKQSTLLHPTTQLQALQRALFLFAKLNPGLRYIQGMNELLAPLYFTFATDPDPATARHAEADAFFCFVELLSEFMDHFCAQLDNSSSGIRATIGRLSAALRLHDHALWHHLTAVNKARILIICLCL